MSSWSQLAANWIKRLGAVASPSAQPVAAPRSVVTGAHALLAVEALGSERIVRDLTAGETRPSGARSLGQNAFGASVQEWVGDDAAASLAAAMGSALGGQRAAVLLSEGSLAACHAVIAAAALRRVPLVVHAVSSADTGSAASYAARGHSPYHALADTGAVLAFAEDAQQAVDKALIARRVAERSLTLGVVAMDGPETAWAPASVQLPDARLIQAYLGAPGDSIEVPTAEQRFLFGERRRRVPRWFDPDRPAAHGMQQSGRELAVALAGQREFVGKPVLEVLRESLADFERATGRKHGLISRYRMDKADHVIVAQGSALGALRALSDYLHAERRQTLGVLGIEWLRPLDGAAIREALAEAKSVVVLERSADLLTDGGPLFREIQSALTEHRPQLLHAVYGVGGQPLANSELLSLYEYMQVGGAGRRGVSLGVSLPELSQEHPRREALVQRVRAEFPEFAKESLRNDLLLDLRPKTAKSVAIWARESESADLDLEAVAQDLAQSVGEHLKSRVTVGEQGTWCAQLTAAPEPFQDPVGIVHFEAAVLATPELPAAINPLAGLAHGAQVLMASPLPAPDLWRELPGTWRKAIVERELRVFVSDAPLTELVAHVPFLLAAGQLASDELSALAWRDYPPAADVTPEPPLAVRRFKKSRSGYDNLPRFWAEHAMPRRERGSAEPAPDPYVSLSAVPSATSSLFEVAVHKNRLPLIDIDRCVGCGACWTACPDSAIMPAVIGVEALLNAAADQAAQPGAPRDPVADKLRRAHRQLAVRINGSLAKEKRTSLDTALLRESYAWLVEQMRVSAEERPAFDAAFEATLGVVTQLPFATTAPFFHAPHAQQKGSGDLLGLSVSPAACQGCGGCSAVCPEEAISVGLRTETAVASASAGFRVWEQLPDPSGESIARAALTPAVGALAAVMSSRHTLLAVTGGGGHEPGSGARVGVRLVAAVTEYEKQRRFLEHLEFLKDLSKRLKDALRASLAKALPSDDLAALQRALSSVPDHAANVGALVQALASAGTASSVDSQTARRLVALATRVDATMHDLQSGQDGLGRSRFGLVIAGSPLAEWAAEFPRNPFAVPVVVDLTSEAFDLALGLAESLLTRHAEQIQLIRLSELALTAPPEATFAAAEQAPLHWRALDAQELASCPAVLVLAGPEAFAGAQAGLARVLASRLPVKVVVLDGRERWLGVTDPVLPLVTQRRAFVLSSTIAHHEHLFTTLSQALQHPGAALAHLYTPSPRRHGFDSADTVARARAAVDSRVHPLFSWDPGSDADAAPRLSLAGNRAVDSPWCPSALDVPVTPAHFALGERRFAEHFVARDGDVLAVEQWLLSSTAERFKTAPVVIAGSVECALDPALSDAALERLENWRTLQQLAALGAPAAAVHDTEDAGVHERALDELRRTHEAQLAEIRASQLGDATARLRSRLIQLAGYGARQPKDEPS